MNFTKFWERVTGVEAKDYEMTIDWLRKEQDKLTAALEAIKGQATTAQKSAEAWQHVCDQVLAKNKEAT